MLDIIINVLIFGVIFGSVNALLAMGFTLVYGVGKILNLAHGGFYLITGYLLYILIRELGLSLPIAMIISLILISIIGGVSYILLIKPLQERETTILIVTFALAFFFEQIITLYYGGKGKFLEPLIPGTIYIFEVGFSAQSAFMIISTLIIVSVLGLFILKSKLGKSIRAVSQDREAAMLSGINADRILLYTVIISAFLVGLAAILRVPGGSIAPFMAWTVLTNAFSVVILGGLGSIKGSFLAAYIIGISQSFVSVVWGSDYSNLIPIIIILIVLLIRPRGLFGKKEVK
ncbi:MAG: branched-chain amino acid ABC transporter permease [Promethearchaeati archaeon]